MLNHIYIIALSTSAATCGTIALPAPLRAAFLQPRGRTSPTGSPSSRVQSLVATVGQSSGQLPRVTAPSLELSRSCRRSLRELVWEVVPVSLPVKLCASLRSDRMPCFLLFLPCEECDRPDSYLVLVASRSALDWPDCSIWCRSDSRFSLLELACSLACPLASLPRA